MKTIHAKSILSFNITIPEHSQIETLNDPNIIVNNLIQAVINLCWEWIFFYFNNDGRLDLYYIVKRRYPVIKSNPSVTFIYCI